jgi:adenylate kinase family enzyme
MSSRRIVVVGTTGSGKTTAANRLSHKLGIPHTELDALNWGPNWQMRPPEQFNAAVEQATRGETWVVDGNYSRAREIVWPRADTIVWLDYPLPLILWRLWWRTLRRGILRQELWSGNRERLWTHFFNRDSLFLWALQTYNRRRREYPELLGRPEYSHLQLVHLRSPNMAEAWIEQL